MERTQHGVTLKHEIPAVSGLVCIGHGCFLGDISLQFVALQLDCNAFCSTEKALTQELSALAQAEVPTLLQSFALLSLLPLSQLPLTMGLPILTYKVVAHRHKRRGGQCRYRRETTVLARLEDF